MTWRVRDCPEHECCALGFPGVGVLCMACGVEVLDTIDGVYSRPAPAPLIEAARVAWNDNQGVRDFTASARERYPQTGDDDGSQVDGAAGGPATPGGG